MMHNKLQEKVGYEIQVRGQLQLKRKWQQSWQHYRK